MHPVHPVLPLFRGIAETAVRRHIVNRAASQQSVLARFAGARPHFLLTAVVQVL